MTRGLLFASLVALAAAQDTGTPVALSSAYIAIAILIDVCLLAMCLFWLKKCGETIYAKPKVPEGRDPKEFAANELQEAFNERNPGRYAGALELAREVGVNSYDIPMVFSLHKQPETFKLPKTTKGPSTVTAQLCFILDYTGSMKEQINQAEKSCSNIVEAVKAMTIKHQPEAKVELEMAAIGYNDWDDKTASLNRPVVTAFGGKDLFKRHDPNMDMGEFNLGGRFTKDKDEIMTWIQQPLGNGGSVPEELTGGLIAATHLPWSAQQKLAVVITDAPCHGKAYSNESHDPFCDQETGLTCTGQPEEPLKKLKELGVQVVILHTGSSGAVRMCQKLQQGQPDLIHEKVSPSETASKLVDVMDAKLQLPPLTYVMKPFIQMGQSNVASNHTAKFAIGYDQKTQEVDHTGLMWIGKADNDPKVSVSRPSNDGLDKWWTASSEEVQIPRRFDERFTYVLKMERKK